MKYLILVLTTNYLFLSYYVPQVKTWPQAHHDDIIKWKRFPPYWPFVRGIHWSPMNCPHERQWCGALKFSLICTWINIWVNNREAGTHYDVTVMICITRLDNIAFFWKLLYSFNKVCLACHVGQYLSFVNISYSIDDSLRDHYFILPLLPFLTKKYVCIFLYQYNLYVEMGICTEWFLRWHTRNEKSLMTQFMIVVWIYGGWNHIDWSWRLITVRLCERWGYVRSGSISLPIIKRYVLIKTLKSYFHIDGPSFDGLFYWQRLIR